MDFSFLDKLTADPGPPEEASEWADEPVAELNDAHHRDVDVDQLKEEASKRQHLPQADQQAPPKPRTPDHPTTVTTDSDQPDASKEAKRKTRGKVSANCSTTTYEEHSTESHDSPTQPGLRRSKRIAKKVVCGTKSSRKTESAIKSRISRLTRKGGKSEVPKGDYSFLRGIATPAKDPTLPSGTAYQIQSSTPYGTPSSGLRKLPTTPGPVQNRSLLRVALGNVTQKHSAPTGPQTVNHNSQSPAKQQHTSTSAQKRLDTAENVVDSVEQPATAGCSDKHDDATETVKLLTEKAKDEKPKKLRFTEAVPSKTAVPGIAPVNPPLSPQRSRIAKLKPNLGAANEKKRPLVTLSSNVAVKPIKEQTKVTAVAKRPSRSPPKGAQLVRKSAGRKVVFENGNQIPKSLKSIIKKSDTKSARVKASATQGLRVAADALTKSQQNNKPNDVSAQRKSTVKGNQKYKHVQSKVAQIIHGGPLVPAVRKAKDISAVAVTSSTNTHVVPQRKSVHVKTLPTENIRRKTVVDVPHSNRMANAVIVDQTLSNRLVKNV